MGVQHPHSLFSKNAPVAGAFLPSRTWLTSARLSSIGDRAEAFLNNASLDRGPWLAVALACGIGAWFTLQSPWQWTALAAFLTLGIVAAIAIWRGVDSRAATLIAIVSLGATMLAGLIGVWARSEMIGTSAIDRPSVEWIDARVLERIEQPAQDRIRLVLATRDSDTGQAIKVRVNLPIAKDQPGLAEGARVNLRARLLPPAPPMLPGSYDFARVAWFKGLAASGSVIGDVEIIDPAAGEDSVAHLQRGLSGHVRAQLPGSAGHIAAAFASGDRGAIGKDDQVAMRDAGLTHLLAISGLHVSAVIGAAYFLALKLLSLLPWLTLRVRLPLMAAGIGALAGIGYTILTGAQVPTVRSCIAAVLVMIALALGREPLSLRMVAVAAIAVMIAWPEALIGPSFQMSFCAVIAIVALHTSSIVRAFLAPREEIWLRWFARRVIMLFITGMVIELALTPIVLFHFHRAGLYGAFANVIAIPLVTFISMPLIAVALLLDLVGLGQPVWWIVGVSLDLLLWIANVTAGMPGAVKLVPQISIASLLLFLFGGLWLALWKGRARLMGFAPIALAALSFTAAPTPDILVSRDGRHVGIAGEANRLLVLRDSKSSYARDNLLELTGLEGEPIALDRWPGARCSADFCTVGMTRGEKDWSILIARSRELVGERELAAACAQVDIVIADRRLPRSCKPLWLKADRRMLEQAGGLSINLDKAEITRVSDSQGEHGWWRGDQWTRKRR